MTRHNFAKALRPIPAPASSFLTTICCSIEDFELPIPVDLGEDKAVSHPFDGGNDQQGLSRYTLLDRSCRSSLPLEAWAGCLGAWIQFPVKRTFGLNCFSHYYRTVVVVVVVVGPAFSYHYYSPLSAEQG